MVARRPRSLRTPALARRLLSAPYRGVAAAVATLLLFATVIHLHHTRITFLELHLRWVCRGSHRLGGIVVLRNDKKYQSILWFLKQICT